MIDIVPLSLDRRRRSPLGLVAALVCVALASPAAAAPALPDWDAAKKGEGGKKDDKKPAPLPDWDAEKKGDKKGNKKGDKKDPPASGDKKTAPLPDWDAAKKKDGEPAKGKKPTPKKKGDKKPDEAPPEETPPAPETPPPEETPPAPETPPPEEAPAAEPPASEPAPEATPVDAPPVIEGPTPEPAPFLDHDDTAALRRQAKGLLVSGGVLVGGGLAGVGVMTAGFLSDDAARRDTLIAAGAVTGVIGVTMGLALVGEGVRELKAARRRESARLQVEPTLGGVVLRGRF